MAEDLLSNGYKEVRLLPQISETEQAMRVRYFGENFDKLHYSKNPDFKINGVLCEAKTCTKNRMSQRILDASKQSNIAIIKTKEVLTDDYIDRFVKRQWAMQDRDNIETIMILNGSELRNFKRP